MLYYDLIIMAQFWRAVGHVNCVAKSDAWGSRSTKTTRVL